MINPLLYYAVLFYYLIQCSFPPISTTGYTNDLHLLLSVFIVSGNLSRIDRSPAMTSAHAVVVSAMLLIHVQFRTAQTKGHFIQKSLTPYLQINSTHNIRIYEMVAEVLV